MTRPSCGVSRKQGDRRDGMKSGGLWQDGPRREGDLPGLAGGGVEQVRGSKARVLSGYVLEGTGRGCVP